MPKGMDWLARRIAGLEQQVRSISTRPQLANSSIEAGAINEYDPDGNVMSRTGEQHDGTHGTVILSGPAPPQPTAPIVIPDIASLRVRWDGNFVDDAIVPLDFTRVEVHASTDPGFTPDTADTLLNTIDTPRGGEVQLALPTEPYTVAFVARSASGKYSTPSEYTTDTPIDFGDAVGELGLGTNIYYGPSTPSGAVEGELWYHETAPGSGLYIVQRLLGGVWTTIELEGIADAVAQAIAAQLAADAADANALAAASAASAAQSTANAAQAAANGKATVYYSASAPSGGTYSTNDLWLDSDDNKVYRWSGAAWLAAQDTGIAAAVAAAAGAQGTADGKARVFVQTAAPTGMVAGDVGDLWIDSDDGNKLYAWSGSAWTVRQDTSIGTALANAATAQTAANAATAGLVGKITSYYQTTAPTGGTYVAGDFWLDTDDGNKLYRWSGSAWTAVQDTAIQTALTQVGTAQATADGKARVFIQTAQPTGQVAGDVGDVWIDTDDGNKLYVYSGSAWVLRQDASIAAAQTAADAAALAANGRATIYYATTAPTGGTYRANDLWLDSDDGNKLYRWSGSAWVASPDGAIATAATSAATAQATADGKAQVYVQAAQPTGQVAGDIGDVWIDTDDANKMYVYSGSAWVLRQDAAGALTAAQAALAAANGKATFYYASTAPTGGTYSTNDLWTDSDDKMLYRWSGSAWVAIQDTGIAAAIASAAGAQGTADGKARVFPQTAAPTGLVAGDVGDVWIDTDDGNKLYVWSGSAWVLRQDASIATALTNAAAAQTTANAKITSYFQTTAPTGGTYTAGDFWLDTDDGNKLYRWSGSAWTAVQDAAIQSALTQVGTAQATADGKARVFVQTAAPTGMVAGDVGDVWVDSDDANKMYIWSGSAWVLRQDTSIAASMTAYIQSRGTDLVTNGTGMLGNNTNFTQFTFDPIDRPTGTAGSFDTATGGTTVTSDEAMPIDTSRTYLLRVQAKQKGTPTTAQIYAGLVPVDADGLTISPQQWMTTLGTNALPTLTTLSAALNPGDTVVHLASAANWNNATPAGNTWQRGFIFWDYIDGKGYHWPVNTYSRNAYLTMFGVGAISGNDITLSAPWAGPAKPIGTQVSQSNAGGSYMYVAAAGNSVPAAWTTFQGFATGIHTNQQASATNAFPPGCASVRIVFLPNTLGTVATSKHSFAAISFSDSTSKITSYFQTTAPTGGAYVAGDFWLDTDDGNKLYRWSGSAWVAVQDTAIQTALTNAGTAQATADGKVRTFIQTAAPTGMFPEDVGDVWIDTDDGNRMYTWNGTIWVSRQFGNGAIQPASLVASNVIATGTITGALIEAGAITADKIQAGTITAASGVIASAAITDANIATLSAGKITTGTLSAQVTLSGKIATAMSGARVEMDSAGVRAYDSGGVNTVNVDNAGNAALAGQVKSTSYLANTAGYLFDADTAQVQNLNVINELGTGKLTAQSLTLGVDDLAISLDALPKGIIAYGKLGGATTDSTANTVSTSLSGWIELGVGSLQADRFYKITAHFHAFGSVTGDAYDWRFNYTVDGTSPTTTSAIMDGSLQRWNVTDPVSEHVTMVVYYTPDNDYDNVRLLLTAGRVVGTGNVHITLNDVNRRLEWAVEDLGLEVSAVANTAISQRSKAGGGGADGPPINTYTKTFPSTWSRSFNWTAGTAYTPDTNDLLNGGTPNAAATNKLSLIGFDYANIQAKLAGATYVTFYLLVRCKEAIDYNGIDLIIGGHRYTARPATIDDATIDQNTASSLDLVEGGTRAIPLSSTYFTNFKSGTFRGIALGPGNGDNSARYAGTIYGFGSGYDPKLVVTYSKPNT